MKTFDSGPLLITFHCLNHFLKQNMVLMAHKSNGFICLQVNRVTMVGHVDSSNPNESIGPAKLTGEVLDIMDRIPDAVTAFTGQKLGMSA